MATQLLDTDGTASMATFIMCSHHAFRRDLACFVEALARISAGDLARVDAVRDEWTQFRNGLHGHHTVEDTGMFPQLLAAHPDLASAIATLGEQHREIDPLLERGDRVFATLPLQIAEATAVIEALVRHIGTHLDTEEASVIPYLRTNKKFEAPITDETVAMYAAGFSWATAGIATSVHAQVFAMLPPAIVERIPAAREQFDARCVRAWGRVHVDAAFTSA